MEAIARWVDGLRFDAEVSSGHVIPLDSSADQGGANSGARPVELLLAGLAGCTGMDVAEILRRKRQKVTRFEVRVEGDRREEHPRVFTKIHVTYEITGLGLDAEAVRQAVTLSEGKYCSVAAMLRAVARITTEIRVRETEP
jgi:putative redox protein